MPTANGDRTTISYVNPTDEEVSHVDTTLAHSRRQPTAAHSLRLGYDRLRSS